MKKNIKARSYEGTNGKLKWKIREAPYKLFMLNNSTEKWKNSSIWYEIKFYIDHNYLSFFNTFSTHFTINKL